MFTHIPILTLSYIYNTRFRRIFSRFPCVTNRIERIGRPEIHTPPILLHRHAHQLLNRVVLHNTGRMGERGGCDVDNL